MLKNGSFSLTELNDAAGFVDFEFTLEVPEIDGGGFVHLQGRINVTKLPPETKQS